MRHQLRGGRLGLIALSTLVLTAGCGPGSTVGSPQSGVPTFPVGGLGSTSVAATPSTTAAPSIHTSATPASSRQTLSPADADGRPAPGARTVFTVAEVPTYYCETTHTLVPQVVVYDDGTVLITDNIGAYCDRVPTVRVGVIDRAELDRLAFGFFDSPDAAVDISTLPISDGGNTTVTFRASGGVVRSVLVYSLGSEDFVAPQDLTAEEKRARKHLADLIDAVTAYAEGGVRWTPDRLVLACGSACECECGQPPPEDPVRAWPIPVSRTVRTVISAAARDGRTRLSGPFVCAVVDDPKQVIAVLKAQGDSSAEARWNFAGQERRLAVGIVLPGYPACAS